MYDRIEIAVKAGDGGEGAISFHREKFIPFGGPDGGDGGGGGDVIAMADSTITDLRKYKGRKLLKAANGKNGMEKRKHGKRGETLLLTVPAGTIISDKSEADGNMFVADLEQDGQQVLIARGGKGGWGNTHFTSSTNQAPQIAQIGEVGEEKYIILEMRLIADVGIIGYPNAGKSTLLSAASAAKPKIASYPFTTLEPVLGLVEVGKESFVMADLPGLIKDAHIGRGLGHDFLQHIMRTRVLIHLIDGDSASPVENMIQVNAELGLFDAVLARKPQIVAVNKIDIPEVQDRLTGIKDSFRDVGTNVHFISAITGEGIDKLITETMKVLREVKVVKDTVQEVHEKVFRPQPRVGDIKVFKDGEVFVIAVPALERIKTRSGGVSSEARWQLKRQIVRMGISKVLEKAGIKPGDRIRCGKLEWDW